MIESVDATTTIDNYIVELDDMYLKMMDNKVKNNGLYPTLKEHTKYLDCTQVWKSGMRPIQTPFYPYRVEVSTFIYFINKINNKIIRKKYYDMLLEIHHKNLEYEKINPPIMYDKRQVKVTRERKKRNVLSDEERQRRIAKQEQLAIIREAKEAAKKARFGMLGLKLKIK